MQVEVTVRRLNLSDAVQRYAQDKGERLIEKFRAIEFVRVVLDEDGPFCVANISIQGGQGATAESNHKDPEIMAAINAAFDKAEAQLRKNTERRQDVRS
ncbi:MAG: HPF/RaiA family ribosome-associated protein [Kiritimatiellia bacterium]|jgi:ribosomal subunit interface protein